MLKAFFLFFLFLNVLYAQSYSFTEVRYSDAIGKSMQLNGEITFKKEGLEIKYPKSQRVLDYDGEEINFFEDGKLIELPSEQISNMMHYFDILKLLHDGNEDELKSRFTIKELDGKTFLSPTGTLKYYIEHIELLKINNTLKYIKLFLKNSDSITINITNEIS